MRTLRFRTTVALGAAATLLMITATVSPARADGNGNRGDESIASERSQGRDDGGDDHDGGRRDDERDRRRAGGTCTTSFQFTGPSTIHIDGRCRLLHLGATSSVAEQTVSQGPNGTLLAVNETVYTAASGDKLFSHFEGTASPTSPTELALSGTETYHGGTGRFARARGQSALTGSVQFTSASGGVGQFTTRGHLSY